MTEKEGKKSEKRRKRRKRRKGKKKRRGKNPKDLVDAGTMSPQTAYPAREDLLVNFLAIIKF